MPQSASGVCSALIAAVKTRNFAEESGGRREAAQREQEQRHARGDERTAVREPSEAVVAVEVLAAPRHDVMTAKAPMLLTA